SPPADGPHRTSGHVRGLRTVVGICRTSSTPLPREFRVETREARIRVRCARRGGRLRTMGLVFARLHTLATTAEQAEVGLALVRDELLPWPRESSGYCGLIGLVDRASGKALVLTLWADDAMLQQSAENGDRLSSLAAAASGATRQSLESFEVSLF